MRRRRQVSLAAMAGMLALGMGLAQAGAARAQQLPFGPAAGSGGLVEMGLEDYEALRAAAEASRWTAGHAEYRIEVNASGSLVQATYSGELGQGKALPHPLPSGKVAIRSVLVDGQAGEVVPAPAGWSVLIPCAGQHRIDASLRVFCTLEDSGFVLGVPEVASSRVLLTLQPDEMEVSSADGTVEKVTRAGGRLSAEIVLEPTGRLSLAWRKRSRQPPPDSAIAPRPASVDGLLWLSDELLRMRFLLGQGGRRSDFSTAVVRLSSDVEVNGVTELSGGRPVPHTLSPAAEGGQKLRIRAGEGAPAVRGLSIEASLRLPGAGGRVRLEVPALEGASTQRGLLGWQRPETGRLASLASGGLTTMDPAEFPETLRAGGGEELEKLYRYGGLPAWLELELKSPGRASGGDTVARELEVRSEIAPDGRISSRLNYRFKNDRASIAEFELPPGMELLTAHEDGQPLAVGQRLVGGVRRAGVALRVVAGEAWSNLELLVQQPGAGLSLLSSVALALPTASMEVQGMTWTVQTPPGYELRAPHGSLELKPKEAELFGDGSAPSRRVASFRRDRVSPAEALWSKGLAVSEGLIGLLEGVVFLLACLVPLAAAAAGVQSKLAPLALLPGAIGTILAGPLLPEPWRPLLSGFALALALVSLKVLTAQPRR